MHMADALVSPTVGGAFAILAAGAVVFSSAQLKKRTDDRSIPLMGVLGAFLFTAQMINFSIPGTGSSGHLGGGMLLAILLGPHAALLTMTSVLVVQALFFADGGLLALGCNIFNMGMIPAYLVYPLVYRRMTGGVPSSVRLKVAIIVSAMVTLQLGPASVVLETVLSGVSALPFTTFLLLMQPIHALIGIMEGIITAAVVSLVWQARPEIKPSATPAAESPGHALRTVMMAFAVAAVLTGGVFSLFASAKPDGLEWAIQRVVGQNGVQAGGTRVHALLEATQERFAMLPDYSFKTVAAPAKAAEGAERAGTAVAGLIGGLVTMLVLMLGGLALKKARTSA